MKYFKGYKIKSIIAVLAKLVEAVFELMLPLLMAKLIDDGIQNHDMQVVYRLVIGMLLLTLFGYLFSLICQYYASHVSQQVGGALRRDVFAKIQTFGKDEYELFSSAALTNRMTTDIVQIQDMIARTIRLGVRAPLLMIGSIVALSSINPRLAQTLLWSFPLFVVVVVGFMYLSQKKHMLASTQLDKLVGFAGQNLSGMRIIRAFSKQSQAQDVFESENRELASKQQKVGMIAVLSSPLTTLIMNVVLIIMLYQGAFEIFQGNMSQGQILAVINYCTQLVLTLIVAMNLVMIFSRGVVSKKRIETILKVDPKVQDGDVVLTTPVASIEFKDVSYRYPDSKQNVLDNINMTLNAGETVGVVGLTGSGKSTLANLIIRYTDVSEGVLLVNERPIQSYTLESYRNAIGYITQKSQFLQGSLAKNVDHFGNGDVEKALTQAQGKDILNKGLDARIEAGGQNLSGGQRQRVNIARNFAKKPDVLIFDDSFSALDNLTNKALTGVLNHEFNRELKLIFTQRPSFVMNADMIYVLDKGRIIDQGTHEQLIQSCELYARMVALQMDGGEDRV